MPKFNSYTLLLAEKHFEDPESKKIFIAVALISDYLWAFHTLRFERSFTKKSHAKAQDSSTPQAVVEKALAELRAAHEKTKELPAQIKNV